jgi:transposase InsO family protein
MHANARLTPRSRLTLVGRIAAGRPVAHVAAEMGVSRPTAYKWWHRFEVEGVEGLVDRSSRPESCPHRTCPELEAEIARLRADARWGPARISLALGIPASTVHRVLVRLGINRLAWFDRPTGRRIRRYEKATPGELVHVDIKKLGRIPDGGGWRAWGRSEEVRGRGIGWVYVHSAVDDHSRLAYSEVLADEKGTTCAGFWTRAAAFYANHGIAVTGVMTDNAKAYLGHAFADALAATGTRRWAIPPRQPQINGKVERFNRTLLDEWAYAQVFHSDHQRTAALDDWLHTYNHHRGHTAIGGPPISRVNDLPGHYS